MIDYISGTLASKKPTVAVVDVQGLGYQLLITTATYQLLPAIGKPVRLFAYQHVREDLLQLYGFASQAERMMFTCMIGVSGVGPKLALAALSAMNPMEIRRYVLDRDSAPLTMIPGVGRKTAERMIVDLSDRLARMSFEDGDATGPVGDGRARADALAALETLGLSRAVADKRVRRVLRAHPTLETADKIVRLALRD